MTDELPKQYELRYLFFVTTCVAIGVWLVCNFTGSLRLIGLGICSYWVAKAFFAGSVRLPKVVREIVFLFGLPFFAIAVYWLLSGFIRLLFDLQAAYFA